VIAWHPITCAALPLQFLVIADGSPNVPNQLRRMLAWETIGGLSVFWR
jgi:hypothetical protein